MYVYIHVYTIHASITISVFQFITRFTPISQVCLHQTPTVIISIDGVNVYGALREQTVASEWERALD